jgi:predicted O-linked N-acetylglucosamine transferase (SPINDLY family)
MTKTVASASSSFVAMAAESLRRGSWPQLQTLVTHERLAALPADDIAPALEFLLKAPAGWSRAGEPDAYADYLTHALAAIRQFAVLAPLDTKPIIDGVILEKLDIGLGLFGSGNAKPLARNRALLLQDVLRRTYPELLLEHRGPKPPPNKRRLGVIIRYFKPFIDNWMLAGFLSHLPRERYEITLYSVQDIQGRIDPEAEDTREFRERFMGLIDRYVPLDRADVVETVEAIRRDRQDIVLFGSTMQISTAKAHLVHAYRMAPVQIATTITTSTTGFDNIDYYVSAACTEPADAAEHYQEQLRLLPGFFYALAFDPLPKLAEHVLTAAAGAFITALNLPPDASLLISGAAWPKLTQETVAMWIDILKHAFAAHLALYPNSPSWRAADFAQAQARFIGEQFDKAGIDRLRLHIVDPKEPEDILRLAARADIYLDAYPYSGNMSLREPLLMGCPPVTRTAAHQRGLQGPALLRSLGLNELVAASAADYRDKVLGLLKDKSTLKKTRANIVTAMKSAPCYDAVAIGKDFAALLDAIKL